MRSLLIIAILLAGVPAWAGGDTDAERLAARARLYAQIADHNLLQIMLVVPGKNATGALQKRAESGWVLHGEVLCVDVGPLREEVQTRDLLEFPDGARKAPIDAGEFYRAVRFDPPRLLPAREDTDFEADLDAALRRFAQAKLAHKVVIEFSGAASGGCNTDVVALPAIRLYGRANPKSPESSWYARVQRGEAAVLGVVRTAELRSGRGDRISAAATQPPGRASGRSVTPAAARPEETTYSALRIAAGHCKPCYVASTDPVPELAAWTMVSSPAVRRWVNGAVDNPKAIADLDAILGEFRKQDPQRQCTLLVAASAVLVKVKAVLEREGRAPGFFPETFSGTQVLAAYGFRTVGEVRFARAAGIATGAEFASLRAAGIDTPAAFESAARRYSWHYPDARPDAQTLVQFVRDEREAALRGMSVKALRAERSKRDQAHSRDTGPLPG